MRTFEPRGTRRATSSAVIIFVSEAIGSTRVGARRHSTRPVSMSNSSPDRGGWRKWTRTGTPPTSSRTASGDGAVPPPASGAGPFAVSGSVAAGRDATEACTGGRGPPARRLRRRQGRHRVVHGGPGAADRRLVARQHDGEEGEREERRPEQRPRGSM